MANSKKSNKTSISREEATRAREILENRHRPLSEAQGKWRGWSAVSRAITLMNMESPRTLAASLKRLVDALMSVGHADVLDKVEAEDGLLPATSKAIASLRIGKGVEEVASDLASWLESEFWQEIENEIGFRLGHLIDARLKVDRRLTESAERTSSEVDRLDRPVSHPQDTPHSPPAIPENSVQHLINEFRNNGETWILTFGGETVIIKHRIGLAYIQALIRAPEMGIRVSALEGSGGALERGAVVMDSDARRAYEDRIEELQSNMDEARARGDDSGCENAGKEMAQLVEEVERHKSPGGQPRRLKDPGEQARVRVGKSISNAMAAIQKAHPQLFEHLKASLIDPTGMNPRYRPAAPTTWVLN